MTLAQAHMLRDEWIYQHPIMLLMDFIARALGNKSGIIPQRESAPRALSKRTAAQQAMIDAIIAAKNE